MSATTRLSRLRVLAAAASAALLAGCMNLAPRYERPAAPVAPAYAPELTPAGAAAAAPAAAEIEWPRFFADPRLKRLIELALANNRDLRVAVLNIEQARAQYQIRRADELPTVGAGISAVRQAGTSGGLVNVYSVGLQVTSYELDFFGRVRNLGEAALAQYLATDEARKTTQIALIAGVATTYVSLLADEELLRVTRDTLKTREDSSRLTKLRFDNGASSEVDVRQAEQLLETAKATLAQTQRQRALDENALTLLVGQALPAELPEPLPLAAQQAVADLPAGLPSDLLQRRPDLRSAEQQLLAANANIGAARAALFPRISLTANAGTASTELSGLFKSGTWAITGSASLLQTIFDSGRNQANLDVAKVGKEIAVAQYEKAIQTAFREVSDSLAGRATLGEQLRAQTAVANAAQASFKLADLRYRNGVASYFDLLDAQRTLFSAQQAAVQVQSAQVQNLVTLYKVLGGGWTEPVR
ncbi:MAG TPA: efflux transporter outer membrane subunit [Burkholderiaceae bacterium]|nr:efflux transporter outer membrane subunit [Burkholderiaceae bacterium]